MKLVTKMEPNILHVIILSSIFVFIEGIPLKVRFNFINDFITRQERPSSIISFLELNQYEKVIFARELSNKHRNSAFGGHLENGNIIYLADLTEVSTIQILNKANNNDNNILKSPVRWLLFYKRESLKQHENLGNNTAKDLIIYDDNNKEEINDEIRDNIANKLASIYTAINTEIYIAVECQYNVHLYLVYKIREHMPLLWEECGIWNQRRGFDRSPSIIVLSMRRLDLQRVKMSASAVISDNRTVNDMPHYRNVHIDVTSKFMYYPTLHLFEWLNVTGSINATTSYGYLQANGHFDGMTGELAAGRSEFSAGVIFPTEIRMKYAHFVTSPTTINAVFVFKKPPLATIANIYSLPFSRGVWISVILLVLISTLALCIASLWEMITLKNVKLKMSFTQRMSQNFHDTLCLVFQQGITFEFYSSSARQVLLFGLMSSMFLYTAYSANVVALLQSVTNEINSVTTLLNSPLQCGTEDVIYNRKYFSTDTRPLYRAFWLKKGLIQGDNFYISAEEGIRRVRQGLYAFHVEVTLAYYHIQRSFEEHEKCNLAEIRYFTFSEPHICTAKKSTSKEQLRVGIMRIVETGLQSRSNRRLIPSRSICAGRAMFTPVSILYVTPIFKYLIFIYCTSFIILGLEIYVHRREKQIDLKKTLNDKEDNMPENLF